MLYSIQIKMAEEQQTMGTIPQDVPQPPPIKGENKTEQETDQDESPSLNALNLVWSFGLNRSVPLLNMTNGERKMIAYTCAHTAVLYDVNRNDQTLLQGHSNALTCTCTSGDKRWLATGDKGSDSMVIVWDTTTGMPVRTMFDPHEGGVVAIGMTDDAKYLAMLSAGDPQVLSLWDWTVEGETPVCSVTLHGSTGVQNFIHFNPEDYHQLITNSESQVVFYKWAPEKEIEHCMPPLTDEDFNKQVGRYSQSIYMRNSSRALTATSVGNLVVWDVNKPHNKVASTEPSPNKKALKLVKLQDRALNVLTVTDDYIVVGDTHGHIKFFDQSLKLVHWYQDFNLGPVASLSFSYFPDFNKAEQKGNYPSDSTIAGNKFVVRDFTVGTSNAVFAYLKTEGTDLTIIHKDHDSSVHALSAHPSEPRMVVASYSGLIKVWDYEEKTVLVSRMFEKGSIRCCTFNPTAEYIAVGFMSGVVRVLDALSLLDISQYPFKYARDAITHVAFSYDSTFLATADAENTMSLFRRRPRDVDNTVYSYVGRYRAHHRFIVDIMFGINLDSNTPRLVSLGEDRIMVEYDLENSEPEIGLLVKNTDRLEQSAVPLCCAWYPPITKESFILTSNDQFKFKLYNTTTKMCRKTLLAPTYGSPMQKLVVLPTADAVNDKRYVAYITVDKVGLHSLPLDGNPHNAVALIAHPQGVANLVSSYDGKYIFTAGGDDATVHMWQINVNALEAQSKLGGEGLTPFYGLLDGGREGELFRELEDYFYYAQIRSQGVNTTDTREISTVIPLSEVQFVMRALGFYPSEQEIVDMENEVKYSKYVETKEMIDEIDLGDLIKLYINHRPAFGLEPEKLMWAFDVLGVETDTGDMVLERGELLDYLQQKGEHMTEIKLAECLTTLLGFSEEGGSSEQQEFDPAAAGQIIDEHLPHELNADTFANKLLGLGMYGGEFLAVNSHSNAILAAPQASAS